MKEATRMLIASGLIPKQMIEQLVNWKALPEEALTEAGSHEGFSEDKARKFLEYLEQLVDEEQESVRETSLGIEGDLTFVWLEGMSPGAPLMLLQDKMGRIHIPAHFIEAEDVKKVRVGQYNNELEVVRVEEEYMGEDLAFLALSLEGKEQADEVLN